MPQEFVARNLRVRPSTSYIVEETGPLDGYRPSYSYERLGDVRNHFPVFAYAGPGVIAFMNPETRDVAMPSPEWAKYWFEHVLGHEIEHVENEVNGRGQDEYGCNVVATRKQGMFDFFPIKGSYSPPNGLY